MMRALLNLDRRIIFLGVTVCALLPLLHPLNLPVAVTPEVKAIYDRIEGLPEGSPLLVSMDFDPASAPELMPMAMAVLRHSMRRHLRVIGVGLWLPGKGLMESAFAKVAKEWGREEGKDWVDLGVQSGGYAVVINLAQSIKTTFREDVHKHPTADMEALKGVDSLKDLKYQVELQAGEPGIASWYYFGSLPCGYPLAAGTTSVGAPEWYPFLQTKQLDGLMGGMRGAAEYESLIDKPDKALPSMDPLSTTSLLIIALVILGNVMYFLVGRGRK